MSKRNDVYWGNSSENCYDLLLDYVRNLGKGVESKHVPRFQKWIS